MNYRNLDAGVLTAERTRQNRGQQARRRGRSMRGGRRPTTSWQSLQQPLQRSVQRRMPNQHDGTAGVPPAPFLAVRTSLSASLLSRIVLMASIILGAGTAVAWGGDVPEWEASILRFVNGWPDWFKPAMWALQQVGVVGAPLIAGLAIVWFTRRWRHLIPFALVLPLKFFFEKRVIKQLVERERPFTSVGTEINVRGPAFDGLSFPSGHTTTAFATAVLVMAFLPKHWRPLPVVWAAIVATARLYYGEHNFADVVAGAALGTVFATMLWFVFLNPEAEESTADAATTADVAAADDAAAANDVAAAEKRLS